MEILKKKNLLYAPFIDLKLDNGSIVKIYFATNGYQKIKNYKRQELIDSTKKIRIRADAEDLGLGMMLFKRFLFINKIDGQTFQAESKLRIEDYQ